MTKITEKHINRLIEIEASIHYDKAPSSGQDPFVVVDRQSTVLVSAPHGARAHRETDSGGWHEEDEYTAGMAQLLGEICDVSVIAMVAQSEESDPNYHEEKRSEYKKRLRKLIESGLVQYVIDLHGAAENSRHLSSTQLIDLGLGNKNEHLPIPQRQKLVELLEEQLGSGITDRAGKRGFPATGQNTVASFTHNLGASSVQIEMKPELRVAKRKKDSSSFKKDGTPYAAPHDKIMGMLQALTDFIEYLKAERKCPKPTAKN